ncbi:MAG: cysteine desulfurase [Planctomycetota bacterium]
MDRVYLDHNSTSPLRTEVRELWHELLERGLGNPSSLHRSGRAARHVIDMAREQIASALGAHEEEIYFTSGGTESNNLALWGSIESMRPDTVLFSTRTEHASVLEVAEQAESRGHDLRWLSVENTGRLQPETVREAVAYLKTDALLSVHFANNETGTIQPISEIKTALLEAPTTVRLHVDAVQALGRIPIDLRASKVDLASFSAHKVGGPIGVGLLYRRKGIAVQPRNFGGGQELGLRPGTENAASIGAAALAVELAVNEQSTYADRVGKLSSQLWQELQAALPDIRLIGHEADSPHRLPNTITVLLPNSDGKVLVTALDLAGCEASAGSACASGSSEPSHVLLAMGFDRDQARAGLRLSLGPNNNSNDCQHVVDVLRKITNASHAT